MKPGARIEAAIEVLTAFDSTPRPIERMLKEWGRNNRYAGSKDRRAIGAYVFGVMRERARLAYQMQSEDPRALMIAHLATSEQEDWQSCFDGSTHCPTPLTEEEGSALDAPRENPPEAVRLNLPAWLSDDVMKVFGPDTEAAMAAMSSRASLDLRANTLKRTRDEVCAELAAHDILAEPTPHSPDGLRINPSEDGRLPNVEALDAFKSGHFEVQDEGSQLAAQIGNAKPGEQVIDFCAGAGGKTLALAAAMQGKGQIFAFDIEDSKLKNLKSRLARANVRNVQVKRINPGYQPSSNPDPDSALADLAGTADLVFVDAPCSGSGTWRRHPDAKWRLTEADLERYGNLQREVLARAARLVKPGGRMVYVTCSILARENSEQVEEFLKMYREFQCEEVSTDAPRMVTDKGLQLSPHSTGTDGFFISVLRKRA